MPSSPVFRDDGLCDQNFDSIDKNSIFCKNKIKKSSIDLHIFHGSKIEQTLFPRNEVKDNHKTSTTKTYRVKT